MSIVGTRVPHAGEKDSGRLRSSVREERGRASACQQPHSTRRAAALARRSMRSRAIKLDVQFAEAKACGRMDRPFAVTCLALLRQTLATHTQKELLLSIADSLEELIFSRVPSFEGARPRTPGASSGGEYEGLAWFELYKRAEEVAVLVLASVAQY